MAIKSVVVKSPVGRVVIGRPGPQGIQGKQGEQGLPGVDAELPTTATQAQAEDSAGSSVLMWTAQRIWQAIAKWGAAATSLFAGELKGNTERAASVSPGAAYAIDPADGNIHSISLTEDLTLSLPTAPSSGSARTIVVELYQDATGGWTVTWPPIAWRTSDGLEPDTTTIPASGSGVVVLTGISGSWYGHPMMVTI